MRGSRVFSCFFGLVIIFAGIGILFDMLGIKDFNPAGLFSVFIYVYWLEAFKEGKANWGEHSSFYRGVRVFRLLV